MPKQRYIHIHLVVLFILFINPRVMSQLGCTTKTPFYLLCFCYENVYLLELQTLCAFYQSS